MQRLSGMDASFLYMETPESHMHVVGVLILDGSGVDGGFSFETVRGVLESRMHLMPPFRRKLVNVPFGLDHPVWINDADFDIENHLHRIALPPPGDMRALETMVGDIASRQLDRAHPLWELWVVEGMEGGDVALVAKMHHASIDGASGADLMVHLFDLTPEVAEAAPAESEWKPEAAPSDALLAARGLLAQAANPFKIVRQVGKSAGNMVQTVKAVVGSRKDGSAVLPFTAPKTKFSGKLTPHRAVGFGRASLDDLKAIKDHFGGKVNDVVLAVSAYAMRQHLLATDDLPDKPLIASCPISVAAEGNDATNQLSSMFVALPVQEPDPVKQLEEIVESTRTSKEMANALGAETLMDWSQYLAPRLFTLGMRLYSGMGLADLHRPPQNLIVSNVPGPPIPLYSAGAKVKAIYPMGPLLLGAGINVTVLSNMGNVDFGVIACREHVPDVHRITAWMEEGVAALLKAVPAA